MRMGAGRKVDWEMDFGKIWASKWVYLLAPFLDPLLHMTAGCINRTRITNKAFISDGQFEK